MFPGFSQWTFACSDHVHGATLTSAAVQPYKSLFFSPAHFRFVEHLAPALASLKNYVDIDPDKKDIFGIPQLRFHYEWGENDLLMWEHSKKMMIDFFRAAGGEM